MAEILAEDDYAESGPQRDWSDLLRRAGAAGTTAFGLQIDLNAAWRVTEGQVTPASFCDHNCTTEFGNYTCLASSTLNVGVRPSTLTPAAVVLDSFITLREGIAGAQSDFFAAGFWDYCKQYNIPDDVAAAMRNNMEQSGFEVNLFGGNPELHPEITGLIAALRTAGHTVHLTTTGGRFMRDPGYLQAIIDNPPSLIALSADDFDSPEDVQALADMSLEELRSAWKKIPRLHGQRRKAHEAIYTAKLAAATEDFPPILFNMVLHPGNIAQALEMIAVLTRQFPGVLINPFPAQSAFAYEDPVLQAEHAAALRGFVDYMITEQTRAVHGGGSTEPFAPRLHYWLMLRAVFDWADGDDVAAMRMITGDGVWQCYRDSPAGFYVQVGLGADGQVRSSDDQHPGGCLGCFWNKQTVTTSEQLWNRDVDAAAVQQYIQIGKQTLANQSSKPCPGCAFPRLVGHIISTETGMDPRLLPFYLALRRETLGF